VFFDTGRMGSYHALPQSQLPTALVRRKEPVLNSGGTA
jgi:hypothetical protein